MNYQQQNATNYATAATATTGYTYPGGYAAAGQYVGSAGGYGKQQMLKDSLDATTGQSQKLPTRTYDQSAPTSYAHHPTTTATGLKLDK